LPGNAPREGYEQLNPPLPQRFFQHLDFQLRPVQLPLQFGDARFDYPIKRVAQTATVNPMRALLITY